MTRVLLSCPDETFDDQVWTLLLSVATPATLAATVAHRSDPTRLEDLARHPDPDVRAATLERSHTPAHPPGRPAVTDPDVSADARYDLDRHRGVHTPARPIPPSTLADHATSTDPQRRAHAAGHPDTDPELLHDLAGDDDPGVTTALLGRGDLDAHLLGLLADNPDCGYDPVILANPALAREDLRALLLRSAAHGSILGCHVELATTCPDDDRLAVLLSRHPGALGPTILGHPHTGAATIGWAITAGPSRLGGQAAALPHTPDALRLAYLNRRDVDAGLVPAVVARLHPASFGQVPWHLALRCPGPYRTWLAARIAAHVTAAPAHIHLMIAARDLRAGVEDVLAGIADCHTVEHPLTTSADPGRSRP